MERAFRALLTSSAAVSAYLPPLQIEWGARTQGSPYPGVVLNLIDGADGLTLDGPDAFYEGRIQVDCYALAYGDALGLRDAIKAELHGYSGQGFQVIRLDRQQDFSESGATGKPFRFSQDFTIIYEGGENATF